MIRGNAVAIRPALNSGVVGMAQLSRQFANAAKLGDDGAVIHSGTNVRSVRTKVNVECVREWTDKVAMKKGRTTGEIIDALRVRAGMSVRDLAKAAGYSHGSGVQRYISHSFDEELTIKVANKLAGALVGKGDPPIDAQEIYVCAETPVPNGLIVKFEGASTVELPRDVPIFGTALGAPLEFSGLAIEQTMLNSGDVIGYLKRPAVLNGHLSAYGLYVQGSSMAPRFEDGDTIFVTDSRKSQPARIGDDVVVYLRDGDQDDGESASAALVKRLVRRTATYIELEQFTPATTFRIDADRVLRIDRVIPWGELLA